MCSDVAVFEEAELGKGSRQHAVARGRMKVRHTMAVCPDTRLDMRLGMAWRYQTPTAITVDPSPQNERDRFVLNRRRQLPLLFSDGPRQRLRQCERLPATRHASVFASD